MGKPETVKAKKRNPQDATLRNIRALKKRLGELEQRVLRLEEPEVIVPSVQVIGPIGKTSDSLTTTNYELGKIS